MCDRWFCEKHLEPRLAFIKDLRAIEDSPEIRVLYCAETQKKNGHPDFEYSRRKFRELDIEEKRQNELIKQALDKMNHYYEDVEIPEKPLDAEADRKKRVEILLNEEKAKNVKFAEGVETLKTVYGFVVPSEVYLNAEYREYLNHADNMKSVKVILDEYYSKYPKKKRA